MDVIQRKPILTITNRRNADNHPEFLDTDALLERFTPLIKSIHKRFMYYHGVFMNADDYADLYSQIVLEFLRLRRSFDPRRGVDFTGYIKFHLQQRVYHYVMKRQKFTSKELLSRVYQDEDSDTAPMENDMNVVDESSALALERAEAISSIPWESLSERQKTLVQELLIKQSSLEDFAKSDRSTIRSVKTELDELCQLLIDTDKLTQENYYD